MIALIGSGNVAHWVALRLRQSNAFPIAQVYSQDIRHARALADEIGAVPIDDFALLNPHCEIYLFALKDDVYTEVMEKLPFQLPVALHTAGSVSQEVFAGYAAEYGVLYPLQTFTKSVSMLDLDVPLCVETNCINNSKNRVMQLAKILSADCYNVDEYHRSVLHLAAVFACNFSNAMAHIADDLLRADGLSLQMLIPLMRQTLDKLSLMSPAEAQTGPAARHDLSVMKKHIDALPTNELKQLYGKISSYIMQQTVREIR